MLICSSVCGLVFSANCSWAVFLAQPCSLTHPGTAGGWPGDSALLSTFFTSLAGTGGSQGTFCPWLHHPTVDLICASLPCRKPGSMKFPFKENYAWEGSSQIGTQLPTSSRNSSRDHMAFDWNPRTLSVFSLDSLLKTHCFLRCIYYI